MNERKIKVFYPYHMDCISGAPITVHKEVRKRLIGDEFEIDYLKAVSPWFVKRFSNKMRPLIGHISSGLLNLKHMAGDYDVIQTGHSYFHLIWKLLLRESIHIHVCHGTTPGHLPNIPHYTDPTRWLFESADYIIAVSEYVRRKIKEYIGRDSFVILNGVDVVKFSPERKDESILKKYNLWRPLVLNVGRFIKGKRPDLVLDTAKKFSDTCFAIRGDGPLDFELKMYQKKEKLKNVRFLPYLSLQELAILYATSDVLLYPTEYEPCSLSILEAMSSGLPIISHNSGGTKQLVNKEVGFLTKENTVDEVSEYLSFLLENEDIRMKIVKKARERAVKKFSWEIVAKKYGEFYKRVVRRSRF